MLNLISADKILDASFETFVGRTHLFDVLGQRRFKSTGFEHWVQTEMIIALTDRNYSVTTERKVRKECDLIIEIVLILRYELQQQAMQEIKVDHG